MTNAANGITSGTTYGFKFRAVNAVGESAFSSESRFAAATAPAQPNKPTKSLSESTKESIFIEWDEVAATEIPIQGYKLYIDYGDGEYVNVYDGSRNSLQRSYNVTGLSTGESYKFYVTAVNANEESDPSDEESFYSCTQPAQPDAPSRISGTDTDITLGWSNPSDNGGCVITGYRLFRDSGAGGDINTEIDAGTLNTNPYLNEHTVALTAGDTGNVFKFQLYVINAAGEQTSQVAGFILAQEPDKPTNAPTQDTDQSSGTSLYIEVDELLTSENGGTDIISYEI